MSRWHSYLNTATQFLRDYNGDEPFASFLKKEFAKEKKYGSKDRKWIGHLCYCYFRAGKAFPEMNTGERLVTSLFLCSSSPNELLAAIKPGWNELIHLNQHAKFSFIGLTDETGSVFPWKEELSSSINHSQFCESFFIQPLVFIRIRPGKEEIVKSKLQHAGLSFELIDKNCIALDNSSKIDEVIELNKEAVVQDYNSQRVGEFFSESIAATSTIKVWDCCAASGGKSIMAHDINPQIDLTVSDVRESILINLEKRFHTAGIKKYQSFVANLSSPSSATRHLPSPFPMVIADVPCTGSGTWSRTPEQLYYFDAKKIEEYAALQKKIMMNVVPNLLPGGQLLYITCSVFREENEAMVEFLQQQFQLKVFRQEVLKGYDKRADTMFAALLVKSE